MGSGWISNLSPFLSLSSSLAKKGTGSKSNLTPFAARVAPFAVFMVLLALQPALATAFDERTVVAFRGVAAAGVLAVFWSAYRELREPVSSTAADWMAAAAAGFAVAMLWIVLDADWAWMGERAAGFAPVRSDGSLDLGMLALRLFGFVLVVPVMEELFWRSFLMRWIERRDFLAVDPRAVGLAALVLSSAVFALAHNAWASALVAGLVFGTIYRRSGNLRLSILSHAISNATLGGYIIANNDWSLW
jgi:CAAX prenyl protease-like protein